MCSRSARSLPTGDVGLARVETIMATWTTGARSLSTVVALGAIMAGSANAQMSTTTLTASDSASLCAVSTKTGKWTKTDYTMTDSVRKDMCAKRRAARRTQGSSGGDVSLATSSTRIPVSKEPAPAPAPEPTPAPTPVAPTPEPPPVRTDTVVTVMPTPVDTATPAPAPAPLRVKHYGNGFYLGLGGGAGVPTQALREGYDPGVAFVAPIGWDSPNGPLGFRVNLGYTRLAARNDFRSTGLTTGTVNGTTTISQVATTDPQIWSAMADLKLRMPFLGHFGGNSGSGLYLIGGGGLNHFRNYDRSIERTNPEFNTDFTTIHESYTKAAWNAGGGISIGVHNTAVFLESRYVSLITDNNHASFIPITLGVTFY